MVSLTDVLRWVFLLVIGIIQCGFLFYFAWSAYQIRMYPITEYGYIIHEFDPWFNYRATEYMAQNGLTKFFQWYDHRSWYPIGRPIGTTIYPGMQMTAVFIWDAMKLFPSFTFKTPAWIRKIPLKYLADVPERVKFSPMSVNDICCLIPPWFGAIASVFLGLLTYEVSRSVNAMVMATGVMSIIPAHLSRSVGGEFDNECVAMAAICSTFWFWLYSVRTPRSWPCGIFTGLSYVYMVAAWGGYIFVLNMIGLHALILVMLGRFNSGVYKAYTIFFIIGTYGAMQVPVVGSQPLRSVEQLGPLGIFFGYQLLMFCDYYRRTHQMTTAQFVKFRVTVFVGFASVLLIVTVILLPSGYFGPLSSRIRGLFMKHTRTGNPLVDSVAEHQPASPEIYQHELGEALGYAGYGALVCAFKRNNGFYFAALYVFIAVHFSGKMARLVLICAPICSMLCGIWFGFLLDCILQPFLLLLGKKGYSAPLLNEVKKVENVEKVSNSKKTDGKKPKKKTVTVDKKKECEPEEAWPLEEWEETYRLGGMMEFRHQIKWIVFRSVPDDLKSEYQKTRTLWDSDRIRWGRAVLTLFLVFYVLFVSSIPNRVASFVNHCDRVSFSLSSPTVMFKTNAVRGQPGLMIDDYYAGYKWIEKNTPEDSRVMAWWDYGYQITGIANRTSIADGNTWNHEHIATLGKMLTSPQKKAHNAIRHLADYVLVWAGGHGDDLGKSPHLARIGNSVFPDHCGDDDPRCNKFGFYSGNEQDPTPMMRQSLLYNLVQHEQRGPNGPKANPKYFKEVHKTKYGLMRVFEVMNVSQKSKAWIDDPKNRVCDAPGSWYCVGQYPPALEKLIAQRRSFSQVEDFNRKGAKSAYTKLIEKERAKEL